MKDSAPAGEVREEWYQIRKKVGDIAATLPRGVQGPFFNDEFGDVYTNISALEGDGYSPAQLRDYADKLRAVLLRVPGVAQGGLLRRPGRAHRDRRIPNARLTGLGIPPTAIGAGHRRAERTSPARAR